MLILQLEYANNLFHDFEFNHLPFYYSMMKNFTLSLGCSVILCAPAWTQTVPALLTGFLKLNEPVKAEVVVVVPPPEIEKYVGKVEQSSLKDPKWFEEYSKTAKPGVPLPFHEKLGLTKEEYEAYIGLWNKREFKVAQEVGLLLRQGTDGRWNIICSGAAGPITTLRFSEKEDTWKSSNGMMKRIEDIAADPMSILGGWTGKEWKFEEETSLSKLKENFAIGKTSDGKYNILVYRAQELTSSGKRLLDKSLVVRIPITAAAATLVKPKVK